jgi:hypothetical protein
MKEVKEKEQCKRGRGKVVGKKDRYRFVINA